jgi:hypothetical protein
MLSTPAIEHPPKKSRKPSHPNARMAAIRAITARNTTAVKALTRAARLSRAGASYEDNPIASPNVRLDAQLVATCVLKCVAMRLGARLIALSLGGGAVLDVLVQRPDPTACVLGAADDGLAIRPTRRPQTTLDAAHHVQRIRAENRMHIGASRTADLELARHAYEATK